VPILSVNRDETNKVTQIQIEVSRDLNIVIKTTHHRWNWLSSEDLCMCSCHLQSMQMQGTQHGSWPGCSDLNCHLQRQLSMSRLWHQLLTLLFSTLAPLWTSAFNSGIFPYILYITEDYSAAMMWILRSGLLSHESLELKRWKMFQFIHPGDLFSLIQNDLHTTATLPFLVSGSGTLI
jgi:hypothetical protein